MEEKEHSRLSPQKLSSLIAEPLLAAANLNSKLAEIQLHFLLETFFTKNDGDQYEPITVEFEFSHMQTTASGTNADQAMARNLISSVKIPLLSCCPFEKIAVNDITLNFDLEIAGITEAADQKLQELCGSVCDQKVEGKPIISYTIHATALPFPGSVKASIEDYSKKQPTPQNFIIDHLQKAGQEILCPVCQTIAPFDSMQMLSGVNFNCPGCQAMMSFAPESRSTVEQSFQKLADKLKQ